MHKGSDNSKNRYGTWRYRQSGKALIGGDNHCGKAVSRYNCVQLMNKAYENYRAQQLINDGDNKCGKAVRRYKCK